MTARIVCGGILVSSRYSLYIRSRWALGRLQARYGFYTCNSTTSTYLYLYSPYQLPEAHVTGYIIGLMRGSWADFAGEQLWRFHRTENSSNVRLSLFSASPKKGPEYRYRPCDLSSSQLKTVCQEVRMMFFGGVNRSDRIQSVCKQIS